jgi:hypothetical protein
MRVLDIVKRLVNVKSYKENINSQMVYLRVFAYILAVLEVILLVMHLMLFKMQKLVKESTIHESLSWSIAIGLHPLLCVNN